MLGFGTPKLLEDDWKNISGHWNGKFFLGGSKSIGNKAKNQR